MWTSQLRPNFDDINRTGLDSQKGSAPPLECDLDLGQLISQNWKVDQSVRYSHVIKWSAVIGLDARPPIPIYCGRHVKFQKVIIIQSSSEIGDS